VLLANEAAELKPLSRWSRSQIHIMLRYGMWHILLSTERANEL